VTSSQASESSAKEIFVGPGPAFIEIQSIQMSNFECPLDQAKKKVLFLFISW